MIIIPAIDIKDGKCVRLYQGNFDTTSVVAQDALNTAQEFVSVGAEYIHMVDLDGALKGVTINEELILKVVNSIPVPVEMGGGIRDMETIERLLNGGIKRVILGSAALKNPELVKKAVKKFSNKIAVGIDARNEYVSIEGWLNTSNVHYLDFAKVMEDIGVENIIFTDISRDGTLQGPNIEQLLKLKEKVKCKITASGGIKDINNIKVLKDMDIYGAITGKAIYAGELDLKAAIELCR